MKDRFSVLQDILAETKRVLDQSETTLETTKRTAALYSPASPYTRKDWNKTKYHFWTDLENRQN